MLGGYPETTAHFNEANDAPTITRATLRSIRNVFSWPEFRERSTLQAYYDGTQYADRPYNWDGSLPSGSDLVAEPVFPDWIPPLNERRPPCTHQVGRLIVERLTGLLFGKERFPRITCETDLETDDFVQGLIEATGFEEFAKYVRDLGGTQGSVGVSYGWRGGEPVVEAHARNTFLVLDWADASKHVPRHVVKIWKSCMPSVGTDGLLENRETWLAREWQGPLTDRRSKVVTPGAERLYRYVEDPSGREKPKWVRVDTTPINECPFVIIKNSRAHNAEGRGDFQGYEGMIDDLNLVLNATTNGTALNADPTLSIDRDQNLNTGEEVKKGGFNVIYGKASYLEISGSSVTAGLENTDRLRAYVHEGTHVAMLDPEKLKGVQSGEAMRRLMFPSTDWCDGLRLHYGERGLGKVLEGLVRIAQAIVAGAPQMVPAVDEQGEFIVGADGQPVMAESEGYEFKLPPKVTKKIAKGDSGPTEEIAEVLERVPGKGKLLKFVWPPYFPDSAADQLARLQTIKAANGDKPVVSPRRSIEMAMPITGVVDADAELEAIVEGTREMADAMAGSFGVEEGGPPGAFGGSKAKDKAA